VQSGPSLLGGVPTAAAAVGCLCSGQIPATPFDSAQGAVSLPNHAAWAPAVIPTRASVPDHTSGVVPGIAAGSTGFGPKWNFGGVRSSVDEFIAHSQDIARPV